MKSILIRISIPFILILLSLLAFKSGVEVRDHVGLSTEPISILFFHIISFFTFGAKDYGSPVSGPIFWQYVILFVYYAAPINFISIIAETIYIISKPLMPYIIFGKKHYLIIGYGRVGKAAVEAIRSYDQRARIIVIQKILKRDINLKSLSWRLFFVEKDMKSPKAIKAIPYDKCYFIYILTDDEWLNLKIYYDIKDKMGDTFTKMKIFVRLSSSELLSYFKKANSKNQLTGINKQFFNVHTAACNVLLESKGADVVENKEVLKFEKWKISGIETIIIFSFGRFSSAFLSELLNDTNISSCLKIL